MKAIEASISALLLKAPEKGYDVDLEAAPRGLITGTCHRKVSSIKIAERYAPSTVFGGVCTLIHLGALLLVLELAPDTIVPRALLLLYETAYQLCPTPICIHSIGALKQAVSAMAQ